jgi:hypothetical protein
MNGEDPYISSFFAVVCRLLIPENPAYAPIPINENDEVQILGVVTTVITRPQRHLP